MENTNQKWVTGAFLAFSQKTETPVVTPLPTAVLSAASAVAERPADGANSGNPTPVIAPADGPTLTPAAVDSGAPGSASANGPGKSVTAPGANRRTEPGSTGKGVPAVGGVKPARTVDRGF